MKNQPQTLASQFTELTELYYTAPLALYEAVLEYILPGFTIALAEIYAVGNERQTYGGFCHVFIPVERNAQ